MKSWRTTSAMLLWALLSSPITLTAQSITNSVMGCSVVTRQGHKFNVTRFVKISNGIAVYESRGSLHDLWIADIRKITCDDRAYEIVNDTLRPVDAMIDRLQPAAPIDAPRSKAMPQGPLRADSGQVDTAAAEPPKSVLTSPSFIQQSAVAIVPELPKNDPLQPPPAGPPALSPLELYELGKQDAKKYYRGGGAFALGAIMSPTLFGPLIVAAIPASPYSKHNPNLVHYIDDPHYMKGYRKKAQGKKAGSTLLGMLFGLTLLIGAGM